MNTDIMTLANELVYNNKLLCGDDAVGHGELHISKLETCDTEWLRECLNPKFT